MRGLTAVRALGGVLVAAFGLFAVAQGVLVVFFRESDDWEKVLFVVFTLGRRPHADLDRVADAEATASVATRPKRPLSEAKALL